MSAVKDCMACYAKAVPCNLYHVRGWRDEECSNELNDYVAWLCDGCEDALLTLFEGAR